MIHRDIQQGTEEWFTLRLGKVTGSRVSDVMATIKNGEAKTRSDYRFKLLAERLTGQVEAGYTNAAMQWGTDNEPLARAEYEAATGNDVDTVGFSTHPTIEGFGASPDGLVGDGIIEIKCPNSTTHLRWMLAGNIPAEHLPQMYAEMACVDAAWCDFVSFDPRMPPHLQIWVKRLYRDDEKIREIETAVKAFLAEIDATIILLQAV